MPATQRLSMSRLSKKKKEPEFWVSNISDRNVSLSDLALVIRARTHVNLLDSRHYHFTQEQLQLSADSGSLFKKNNLLKVRKLIPPDPIIKKLEISNETIERRTSVYSNLEIVEPQIDELNVSETEFIDQLTTEEE